MMVSDSQMASLRSSAQDNQVEATSEWASEATQPNFYYTLWLQPSHKARPDLKGEQLDSTSW